MIRLVFADLCDHAVTWIGAFAVAAVCGFIGGWTASLLATLEPYPNLRDMSWAVLAFSSVAAVVVIVSAASLTVSVQRRSYALWQLANVGPRMVSTVVLVQLAVVAVLGSLCGTLIEAASFASLFPWVFSSPEYQPIDQVVCDPGLRLMPLVWLATAALFVLGGLKGARSAGRTSPMVALRQPESARKDVTAARVLLSACLALVTWQLAASLFGADPKGLGASMFLPLLMVATLVPVAPAALSILLSAWTSVVPQRRWNAWYVARRTARHGLAGSTSVETPVMVGFAMVAGIYSLGTMLETYIRHQGLSDYSATLDWTSAVLLLGGPVLLCAVGASVSVVMTSKARIRDASLLVACGAQPGTLVAAAVCEALIHALTATLAGAAAVVVSNAVVACAVGMPPLEGLAFGEGLAVSLAGFVLVLVAMLAPTVAALRKEPAAVLAVGD